MLSTVRPSPRIPDAATADALIEDRIAVAEWQSHLGHGDRIAVNASAWASMLTGRVLTLDDAPGGIPGCDRADGRRLGEPVIRMALRRGMRVLARQFVMGRTTEEAPTRADRRLQKKPTYWARPQRRRPMRNATGSPISMRSALSVAARRGSGPIEGPGISWVKLSALASAL